MYNRRVCGHARVNHDDLHWPLYETGMKFFRNIASLTKFRVFQLLAIAAVLLSLYLPHAVASDAAAENTTNTFPASSKKPSRVIVADDASYAPFVFLDSAGSPAGITVDIWKLWSLKTGIPVEFHLMPWEEALASVQSGEADAIGGLFLTGERQKNFDYSKPFFTIATSIFFHEQIHGIRGIEDLQGFPVGIVKGDSSEEQILQNHPKMLLLHYSGAEELVQAARRGEIKAFVADSEVARFYLAKYDQNNIFRETSRPVVSNPQYTAVKKGNTALLAAVQEGFDQISETELRGIVSAWTGKSLLSRISISELQIFGGVVAALLSLFLFWNVNLRRSVARALGEVELRNQDLRDSEARLKAFFDLAPFSCVVNDLQGRYRMVNQAFCRILDMREEQVLGHTSEELGIILDQNDSSESIDELLNFSEVSNKEVIYSSAQGPRYALYSSRLMEFGGEKLILSSTVDITDRKRMEEALRESEDNFTRLFSSAPVPMAFATYVDGYKATTWNESWYRTFGYTREEADSRSGADIGLWVNPEDRRRFVGMVEMQNQVSGLEVLLRRRDGDIRNCEVFGRFIGKAGNQLLMAVYLDVTERRQAENNMRESEERFSKAFRSSPAPMVISDIQTGRFIDVNDQWLRMLGHSREETIGHTSFELGIWEDPEARVRLGGLLREQGTFRDEPVRFVTKSGIVRDTLWSAEKINLGGSEAMLSLIYDFSEMKQAEDALRESESYNKVLFHDSHIPLAVMDPATIRFVDCNNAAFAIYGLTDRSQLLGRTPGELSPPLQYDGTPSDIAAAGYIRRALEQGQAVFEWQHQRPNGELWDTEVHLMAFNHRERKLIQLSLQDITDRKKVEAEKDKLQSQLLQSQKMESVGRLAGGVAHDYNNMLGVILGHAELAMHKADEQHPLYNHLNEIRNAAKRSAELTQQLLAFARRQTIAPKVHDLNTSVSATLQMLRLILGENIELVWLPGTEVFPVKIDLSQFDQLLMNLCVNARDAISGVGRISIETRRMVLDEAYCATNVFFVPGDYAVLSVSDTGCGMDSETRSKIFEPFFTTKGIGQGTGLGLATVYGIVKQNNGFINVYSEPGQGSTFRVYLPRYVGATVVDQEVETDTILRNNDETILVVEDEEVLLDINTTMLLDLGYRVLSAATPTEAISLAGEYTGRIDLLMTDVVMPEMNGRELESQIRRSHPEIECLFMSGYTANVISHHGVLDEGVHFIQKPFSLKDMAAKVRETLGPGRQGSVVSETVCT